MQSLLFHSPPYCPIIFSVSISLFYKLHKLIYFFIGKWVFLNLDSTLQDKNEELSVDVKKLFEEYNKMVSLITTRSLC